MAKKTLSFILALLLAQCAGASEERQNRVCGFKGLSWHEALSKAIGASVAQISRRQKIPGAELELVEFQRVEVIGGRPPQREYRAALFLDKNDSNVQRDLSFWSGNCTSGVLGHDGYIQTLTEAQSYLILSGLDGQYAIEPIVDSDDPWLLIVREYFSKKQRGFYSGGDILGKDLRGVQIGVCKSTDFSSITMFVSCAEAKYPPDESDLLPVLFVYTWGGVMLQVDHEWNIVAPSFEWETGFKLANPFSVKTVLLSSRVFKQ